MLSIPLCSISPGWGDRGQGVVSLYWTHLYGPVAKGWEEKGRGQRSLCYAYLNGPVACGREGQRTEARGHSAVPTCMAQ